MGFVSSLVLRPMPPPPLLPRLSTSWSLSPILVQAIVAASFHILPFHFCYEVNCIFAYNLYKWFGTNEITNCIIEKETNIQSSVL